MLVGGAGTGFTQGKGVFPRRWDVVHASGAAGLGDGSQPACRQAGRRASPAPGLYCPRHPHLPPPHPPVTLAMPSAIFSEMSRSRSRVSLLFLNPCASLASSRRSRSRSRRRSSRISSRRCRSSFSSRLSRPTSLSRR